MEIGYTPYAWSVLGAAAQATSLIPLMTKKCHGGVSRRVTVRDQQTGFIEWASKELLPAALAI